jgi:hypothetical protein
MYEVKIEPPPQRTTRACGERIIGMKRGTVQKLSYFSSRLRKNVDIM